MTGGFTKVALTLLVIVIGVPSLPLTGGMSTPLLLGAVFTIWGVDWMGN